MADSHTFTLASGEKLSVVLNEDSGLGVGCFRISIFADRGELVALPRAGNSIDITTTKGLVEEITARKAVVQERDQVKPTSGKAPGAAGE